MSSEKMDGRESPDQDVAGFEDAASALAAITAERDQLATDKVELNDRLLRSHAEFQNLRKRTERERLELFEYASMEAVRTLLPVLDDFERAMKTPATDKDYGAG